MLKKIFTLAACAIFFATIFTGCGDEKKNSESAGSKNKLMIYTSMKENLIGGIVEGFKKKYPNIDVDYQSGGAGKLMAKVYAEKQSGHIVADVIWTSEIPDFYQMKRDGLLENFRPAVFDELLNPFDDYDGSFTAARLGTLGIVINTEKVKTDPTWEDLATDPLYKDSFEFADPALSGTAYMSFALLEKQFGDEYLQRLRQNGIVKGHGSGQVVDDTANGTVNACLGVDYITFGKIDKGAKIKLVYPQELVMIPSPVAIFKDSNNPDAAKKFVDYLLSQEAQQKIADAGTVPVRKDVKIPGRYNLPTPEEVLQKGIKINYAEILPKKDEAIRNYSELFR